MAILKSRVTGVLASSLSVPSDGGEPQENFVMKPGSIQVVRKIDQQEQRADPRLSGV